MMGDAVTGKFSLPEMGDCALARIDFELEPLSQPSGAGQDSLASGLGSDIDVASSA